MAVTPISLLTVNSSISRMVNDLLMKMDINMSSEIMALTLEEKIKFLESLNGIHEVHGQVDRDELMEKYLQYRINTALNMYLPPFLLIMGTFGNLFSFVILRNKAMTRQSTNLFLAALAVADSIVLIFGLLLRWVGDLSGVDVQNLTDWLCKVVTVIGYTASQYSVWLIIAVTVERYIVVSHPLQANRYCNVKRAKRVITILPLFFLLVNGHLLWTVSLQENTNDILHEPRCGPNVQFSFLVSEIWPWIDATLYALIPLLLICILNTLIIMQTVRATSWRDKFNTGPLLNAEKRKISKDNNTKITMMLLAVSFTFLICTFPMAVVMVCHVRLNETSKSAPFSLIAQRTLIRTIAEMLMYLNHSINFYLYCALGQKFRSEIIRTLCGRTLSSANNMSDHSQHLYCSRACNLNGHYILKSAEETGV